MSKPPGAIFSRKLSGFGAASIAVLLLLPGLAANASADEIPHENFDLVGSNLDVVIALLNSSIMYSERALMAMYNQSMVDVEQNLSVVRGILIPAGQILDDIEDVASSYENLSNLLPPFVGLSTKEDAFSSMESQLLNAMTRIVSASQLENLTGDQKLAALDAIRQANLLIQRMNSTIDGMLVDAGAIMALEVEDGRPFSDNDLIPLIEKLRDLLEIVLAEIDDIVHNEVPWGETEPFLLLWLDDDSYYLGEDIVGGGYLYFNGSFAPSHLVRILMDGSDLVSATTAFDGRFYMRFTIPMNASWAGSHVVQATANTSWEILYSDDISITISLVPTVITLTASKALMSIEEQLELTMSLRDVRGEPLVGSEIRLEYGGLEINFTTDPLGSYSHSIDAADLGYGTHSFQAFYDGELPYAPSSSRVVNVVINIPTSVELNLFSNRYRVGMYIVGNGLLMANGTTPLPNQTITLLVDGIMRANLTTRADGTFSYTLPSEELHSGAHTLTAAFLFRDSIWRYSQDELGFTVYSQKAGEYPFWPYFPGWGDMFPTQEIPYLFFGEYAYITWLVLIALIGLLVRLLQVRSRRRIMAERALSAALEPLDKAMPVPISESAAEDFAKEIAAQEATPSTPNERVVWYYRALLNFLTTKRGIGIRESMTHWEVARFLKALGYPQSAVERATVLFERALYSGTEMTDSDTVMMSSSLSQLVSRGRTVMAHAA